MQNVQQDEVIGKLQRIEKFLEKKELKPFNSAKASQYLHISLSHLYKLTSHRKIPFHKPNGKHLYFYADELDEWIASAPLSNHISTFRHFDRLSATQSSMTTPLSNQVSDDIILEDEEIEPP